MLGYSDEQSGETHKSGGLGMVGQEGNLAGDKERALLITIFTILFLSLFLWKNLIGFCLLL